MKQTRYTQINTQKPLVLLYDCDVSSPVLKPVCLYVVGFTIIR